MQNFLRDEPGLYEGVLNFSSQNGNKRDPNPHSYKYFRVAYQPYKTTAWYGYTGQMLEYESTPAGHFGDVHSELFVIRNGNNTMSPAPWGELSERAMDRVYQQLRGSSQVILDLSEASQTKKMLRAALKLRFSMSGFVKGVVEAARTPKRIPKVAADKWLEYRYGWLPLASSLRDAIDNVDRRLQTETWKIVGRASARTTDVRNTNSFLSADPRVSQREDCSYRVNCSMLFNPPPPTQQTIANWTSIGPELIWEKIPYSFVADWFVNVGDYLRAKENSTLFQRHYAGGTITRTFKKTGVASLRSVQRNPVPEYYPESGELVRKSYGSKADCSGTIKCVSLERSLAFVLPEAELRFKPELNAKRLVDAAALSKRMWGRLL